MYRFIILLGALIILLFPPLFGKYFTIEQEYELQMGMLKILVMYLCCFVFAELPWKPICTKLLAVVVSVVAIGLTYNYVDSIANDKVKKIILVEQHDG